MTYICDVVTYIYDVLTHICDVVTHICDVVTHICDVVTYILVSFSKSWLSPELSSWSMTALSVLRLASRSSSDGV
jgi:hypothetical protein